MTVLIGILCSDGVVIGTDSAMAAGRAATGYTIELHEGAALKIEIIKPDVITAVTGAFGLAQRFNKLAEGAFPELREKFPAVQIIGGYGPVGTPVQRALAGKITPRAVPYEVLTPIEIATTISQVTIMDFQRTQSPHQTQTGWGLGALVAFAHGDTPHLVDFDHIQFHPELKGLPDPNRGDQDRVWRCVSMGMGQKWADSFLAFAYDALFHKKVPTIARAKLAVVWAIKHVKSVNTGLVGGETRLAVLEKIDDKWTAHHEDPGQSLEQLEELENYLRSFGSERAPDAAASSALDLNEELKESATPRPVVEEMSNNDPSGPGGAGA